MVSLVSACKNSAVDGMEHFLVVFSFIPDDKLTWAPAPTAKSAIQIAAHTSLYAARFAKMIRERKLPSHDNLDEFLARRAAEEAAITRRAEIEPIFRAGTDEVLAALDSLTPEEIGSRLVFSADVSVPMTWLMGLPGSHANSHTAQLDYLQTCWDDQEVHF
jgi:hypothetical protein